MKADELENKAALWNKQFEEDVKSGRFFWLTNKAVIDFDAISKALTGGKSSTVAMAGSTEEDQF